MKPVRIEVPATSANLGPGFDCLGLALDIVDTVTVEFDDDGVETHLECGDELEINRHENLVCRAYRAWGEDAGRELPGARFQLESRIPVGKGFGSSAASIVAGLAAAAYAAEAKEDRARILRLAARLEGHADNTSAAVLGGMTVALYENDEVRALNVANHFTFGIALFVPEGTLRTVDARAILPERVPHRDAVFNSSRAAYLTTALMWGLWDEIAPAMDDRLHHPYRARLIPALPDVIASAREAGAYGAALSGGGPSVIALGPPDRMDDVAAAMENAAHTREWTGTALVTRVRNPGLTVKPVE